MSTPKPVSFNPPAGFTAASVDDSRKSSQLFGDSNLESKQIWYITAPASVSIDTIKDMSLRGVRSGKVVLSQKGNEYRFVEDTAENKTYTKLMLPNKAKNGYRIGMLIPHYYSLGRSADIHQQRRDLSIRYFTYNKSLSSPMVTIQVRPQFQPKNLFANSPKALECDTRQWDLV